MAETKPRIVRYIGPPRRISIGGVWLQPEETYQLPSETVDRYPGFFADLTTAPVGSGGPGDSILDREPPKTPRRSPAPKQTTKTTTRTKRASGRK